jgi:WD40 repeat protein
MLGRIALALLGLMPSPDLAQPSPDPRPPAGAFPDSTPLRTWQGHRAGITDVQFSPNGRSVASASLDGTVCVWHVPRFTRTWCAAHGAEVYRLAWSPDGAVLATTGGDARVVQWRGSSGERVSPARFHTGR